MKIVINTVQVAPLPKEYVLTLSEQEMEIIRRAVGIIASTDLVDWYPDKPIPSLPQVHQLCDDIIKATWKSNGGHL